MPQVIAFIGVIGSGKDYQANLLVEKGFVRIDFKDALIDMASDLAGYDVRHDYDWFKEHIVGVKRSINPLMTAHYISDDKRVQTNHPEVMTGRRLLQRLGTEVMRKRDPDYWAKAWFKAAVKVIKDGGNVTCADCRFPNEVQAIRRLSDEWCRINDQNKRISKLIFCDYRSGRYDDKSTHESEKMAQAILRSGVKDGQELLCDDVPLEVPCRRSL
jgi:hypothetical protein